MSPLERRRMLGFGRGFLAPFGAARRLLGQPQAWPWLAVPALVFLLLEVGFIAVSWRYLRPWAREQLTRVDWLPDALALGGSWLVTALAVLLGWLLAMFLAPVFSAPALERVVGITELELRAPARVPLGFFAEFWCGARALLSSLAVILPLVLALSVLELLLPPVAVVSVPLKLLLGALGVAWGLFDYPLTLRGIGARQRLRFMSQHFPIVLGFGCAFSLLFWLPCFGVLMLPVGVAAATQLYWEIERSGQQ
ncbi:MAG TPA: EI24 domain-containing protein [Polyangiaceae bacterium]|nr:EI24 domain-containing protein [Polyangiaceae bacterium]